MEYNKDFLKLRNGRYIIDEDLSAKMVLIKRYHPESLDEESSGFEWSEIGMANLFGILYEKEARYCEEHKSWYTYYQGAWRKDSSAILVGEKIKDFVRLMTLYCGEIVDDEKRDAYLKFVTKMGDRRFRDRILKDAMGELKINANQFDANPYLVNCKNGTYNLQNYTFYEPKWDDFLTKQTRFEHTVDNKVKCKRWEKFISEVCQGEEDKIDFLQRSLGYSLLGKANEECMFILHGKTTRNGKSTLLNTIQYMLGDYSSVAPVGMICKNSRSSSAETASPVLASLKGKRFVTMAESNEYGKMDEEKIKQFTGGEEISARALYEKPITFVPQFTMWLSCNDLPQVTDKSVFSSYRLKVIEFNRHFNEDEEDKNLKTDLIKDDAMKGIFNWMVQGYKNYLKRGLKMSDNLKNVIKQYEKDNDLVAQFLEARCEKSEDDKVKRTDLYLAFKTWAKQNELPKLSSKRFNSELEKQYAWNITRHRNSAYEYYKGVKLKEVI